MEHSVFLGIGSNVGDKVGYLAKALKEISYLPGTEVIRVSSIYQTEPVGEIRQQEFLNAVVEVKTTKDVIGFHRNIKEIEKEIGRKESMRWGPREIDIDILLFGNIELNTEDLKIPHPELLKRNFVLVPFSEIGPTVIHPTMKMQIQNLQVRCHDTHKVTLSEQFSNELQTHIKELLATTSR
jgi:2-amino-4-hydroxy-6-hydroxymethyldihydropteridine diphosphokinase